MYPEPVEIFISKPKTVLLFLGSIGFICLGCWLVSNPEKFAGNRWSPEVVFLVSVVCILLFGAFAIVGAIKVLQKRPAYVLNTQGLIFDTRNPEIAIAKWDEIAGFELMQVKSTKTILVILNNPDQFLDRQPDGFKKRMMAMSQRNYSSPISISSAALQIKHDDLWNLLTGYQQAHLQSKASLT